MRFLRLPIAWLQTGSPDRKGQTYRLEVDVKVGMAVRRNLG